MCWFRGVVYFGEDSSPLERVVRFHAPEELTVRLSCEHVKGVVAIEVQVPDFGFPARVKGEDYPLSIMKNKAIRLHRGLAFMRDGESLRSDAEAQVAKELLINFPAM